MFFIHFLKHYTHTEWSLFLHEKLPDFSNFSRYRIFILSDALKTFSINKWLIKFATFIKDIYFYIKIKSQYNNHRNDNLKLYNVEQYKFQNSLFRISEKVELI